MLACFVAYRRPIYRIFDGDWPLPAKYAVNMPNDSVGHRKLYGHQWSFCERQIHRLPAAISPTMCRSSAGHRPAYLKYASIPVASLEQEAGLKTSSLAKKNYNVNVSNANDRKPPLLLSFQFSILISQKMPPSLAMSATFVVLVLSMLGTCRGCCPNNCGGASSYFF
jgi:hypothetical protein